MQEYPVCTNIFPNNICCMLRHVWKGINNLFIVKSFFQSAMLFAVCNVNTNRVENNGMQESIAIEEAQAAVPGPSRSSAALQEAMCTSS